MKTLIPAILFALAATISCGRGVIFSGEAKCDADPCNCSTECSNLIDKGARDAFKCRLVPISEADDKELCRRLFVDIVGHLPTPEDYAEHCQDRKIDAIVDDLQASALYVSARQRLWADRFGYNDQRTWYQSTLALDDLVARLYKGEIDLPTFAVAAAIHPAVLTSGDAVLVTQVARTANPTIDPKTLAKQPVDGYVEAVFHSLLLRSPSFDELTELANMYRLYEIDPSAPDDGLPGFTARRMRVQPCNCVGAKKAFCQTSNLLGPPLDVSLQLRTPGAADCVNAVPPNSFYVEDARPEEKTTMSAPGRLLVARPDFYEAHVREALVRLLGYDATAALDETANAALVQSLTESLAADGSLRNLEAMIFRSVLYRQAQIPVSPALDCEGKDSPVFAGPRKALDGDAYYASIVALTGHSAGKCDYRFQTRTYPKDVNGAKLTAFAPPHTIYSYDTKSVVTSEPELTGRNTARTLGACVDRTTILKQDDTSPFFTLALDYVTREACGAGDQVLPAGAAGTDDAALQAIVAHQYERFFLDAPTAEESAASLAAMQACLASPNTCPPADVGRRYCSALLKTARFATY